MLLKVNFQKKQTISEQVHCKGISRMESEEEGSIEEARYKVLEIFGKAKGMKALTETMALGQDGGNMEGRMWDESKITALKRLNSDKSTRSLNDH